MTFDPNRRHRRSIRLAGFDYSQPGAYFITVCTHDRRSLFGDVVDWEMSPNEYGRLVAASWDDLPNHYPHVSLDAFVVMPNHVHGVIVLKHHDDVDVGAGFKPARTKRHGLPEIVRGFKTYSSRRINKIRRTPSVPVWQRSYYEHVIPKEDELNAVRQYILDNPAKWSEDVDNPNSILEGRVSNPPALAPEKWTAYCCSGPLTVIPCGLFTSPRNLRIEIGRVEIRRLGGCLGASGN